MRKNISILVIVLVMMALVVGMASAQDERPPVDDDTPPPAADCELNGWKIYVLERMAERYEVSVEEIEGWYCAGHSFSEIAIAFELSMRSDASVAEILAMRAEDMSWPDILVALGLIEEWPPADMGELPDPGDGDGAMPVRPGCDTDGVNPQFERIAEIYDMSYEDVYRWLCGPYDYVITDYTQGEIIGPNHPFTPTDGTNPLDDLQEQPLLKRLKERFPQLPIWGVLP